MIAGFTDRLIEKGSLIYDTSIKQVIPAPERAGDLCALPYIPLQ